MIRRIERTQSLFFFLSSYSPKHTYTLYTYLIVSRGTMVCNTRRVFILLICISFFTVQPSKGSSLRSIDLVLRWRTEDDGPVLNYQRTLKAVEMQAGNTEKKINGMHEMNTEEKHPPVNKAFDPNQSSARRVRKGSDPIHNRSWYAQDTSATTKTKERTALA